jgi:hypothetical protein
MNGEVWIWKEAMVSYFSIFSHCKPGLWRRLSMNKEEWKKLSRKARAHIGL